METQTQTTTTRGLFILLDNKNWLELKARVELCHDGGKLLQHTLTRLSIPRHLWRHSYCYEGRKDSIPKKKKERQEFLRPSLAKLHERIAAAKKEMGGVQVIGLGRLSCECLTGSSELKKRSGTRWRVVGRWRDLMEKAWVAYSTDAALFDPGQMVEITGVIANAAMRSGIEIKMKPNIELQPFDWSEYI